MLSLIALLLACSTPTPAPRLSEVVADPALPAAAGEPVPSEPEVDPASLRPDERKIRVRIETTVELPEQSDQSVHIFLPVPADDDHQTLRRYDIRARIEGAVKTEDVYGNRYWHGELTRNDGVPVRVETTFDVYREVWVGPELDSDFTELLKPDAVRFERFLEASSVVPVGTRAESLRPRLERLREARDSERLTDVARQIWGDLVADPPEGSCVEVNGLFASLLRTEGIAARLETGLYVPFEPASGDALRPHCWTSFYVSNVGWVPTDLVAALQVDGPEATFGRLLADRVLLSVGDDLRLGEHHEAGPLPTFGHAYVELGGEPWEGFSVELSYESEPADP